MKSTTRMFDHLSVSERKIAIQRLTALWALNECGLGGLLHAFQSPFTGLFVGGFAMICIAFICALAENKWKTMLTSLVIVLIIKNLVSPHSPPTAYIAVVFQGLTGALIFRYIPWLLFSSIFFFVLGLIESATQRLLTMTILYGNTLWDAIDKWGEWVTKQWQIILPFSSSGMIISFYLLLHLVTGIFLGWWIRNLIISVNRLWGESTFRLRLGMKDQSELSLTNRNKKIGWKKIMLLVLIPLIILFSYMMPGSKEGIQSGIISIVRALAIIIFWFAFLGPFLVRLIRRWLQKKHEQLSDDIASTMDLFPRLLWIIQKSWKETAGKGLVRRWNDFFLHTFLYALQFQLAYDPDPDGTGAQL